MKKVILAAALVITLASCGNGKSEATATDSTAVSLDTTAVTATDSTVAEIPAPEAPKAVDAVEAVK
jgi:ABC-type uncharacterized transport system auxiliary subunit